MQLKYKTNYCINSNFVPFIKKQCHFDNILMNNDFDDIHKIKSISNQLYNYVDNNNNHHLLHQLYGDCLDDDDIKQTESKQNEMTETKIEDTKTDGTTTSEIKMDEPKMKEKEKIK